MNAARSRVRGRVRKRPAWPDVLLAAGPACDRRARSGRRVADGSGNGTVVKRTATRALTALGAYVAQDLRDADGITRPLLRRAALRLALTRSEPGRGLGSAYLRLDPPRPADAPSPDAAIDVTPRRPLALDPPHRTTSPVPEEPPAGAERAGRAA